MENRPRTIGFEDGTTDVERLLVEPREGHVSVDSVICFNEKIPENAMDMQEVSQSFGVKNTGIAREREDILDGDVLESLHNEVGGGYFRLQNDFCAMGEEYLLGVEFAESITNLDYISSECLQTSVSDSSVLASGGGIDLPWRADLFRIMEVPECENNEFNIKIPECGEICSPSVESEKLVEENPLKSPASCTLQDIGKFHDISSCSFQDIFTDENDTSRSPSVEMLCSPKNEKNDESGQTSQSCETNRFQGQDALVKLLSQTSQSDVLPTQKRSRKPTQRYIDEVADPISRHSKRRREISSSALKDKSLEVKDHKKRRMGSRAMKLPAEDSSVKAIQVPFASLMHKECPKTPAYNMVQSSYRGNLTTKSKDNSVTPENQKKMDDCTPAAHLMKRNDGVSVASQKEGENVIGAHLKKRDECSAALRLMKRSDGVTAATHKKKDQHATGAGLKKRNGRLTAVSQRKGDDCVFAATPEKNVDCLTAVRQKKRDDCPTAESPEEFSGRRKHHRLWTIAEVKTLIDGISQYGVGRWSRIKKLFFSASAHRTSVDLKDKWRNLLKASGMQGQHNQQGEKKRNLAWRPLPKAILRRVCELATMYPYPKGGRPKIAHIRHVSPDRSTDITLSDYRRILRSINGS